MENESFSPHLSCRVRLDNGSEHTATYEDGVWVASDGSCLEGVRAWRFHAVAAVHI
jgi:hypothetical protein